MWYSYPIRRTGWQRGGTFHLTCCDFFATIDITILLCSFTQVMFAYGLSGSGKTFTVFGPDDPAIPEAWFKWATPQDSWGIYPRLAYDLFEMRDQTWKFKMKYFQNVVDIVRDLMSPTGEEKMFKAGMRKDADGFMDVNWCMVANLKSWDDLRATFKKANARKAISPTQFNHQSTRGHCIMTLEVNKPKKDDKSMRQKGRIYVCDLAGTKPSAICPTLTLTNANPKPQP